MENVFFSTARKSGNSFITTIPNDVVKHNHILEGNILKMDIIEVGDNEKLRTYKCLNCNHKFQSSEMNSLCPECNCKVVKEIVITNERRETK